MKPTTAFEEAIRPLSFATPNAARSALLAHPLAADFLLESMIERGVLAALTDGRIAGIHKSAKRADPKAAVSSEWKETWPLRDGLMEMMEDGPQPLTQLRAWLKDDKQPCGHWITLHALWRLIKDGDVLKIDEGYTQSPAFKAKEKARLDLWARDKKVRLEVLKQVGPPYSVDKVIALLRARKDHAIETDDPECPFDQAYVDHLVKNAKEKKEL